MSRYFISQPMRDRTDEEIDAEREEVAGILRLHDPEAEIIPKLTPEELSGKSPLECLGLSMQKLATADLAIFVPGWYTARGCYLEHLCCLEYDIRRLDLILPLSSDLTRNEIAEAASGGKYAVSE